MIPLKQDNSCNIFCSQNYMEMVQNNPLQAINFNKHNQILCLAKNINKGQRNSPLKQNKQNMKVQLNGRLLKNHLINRQKNRSLEDWNMNELEERNQQRKPQINCEKNQINCEKIHDYTKKQKLESKKKQLAMLKNKFNQCVQTQNILKSNLTQLRVKNIQLLQNHYHFALQIQKIRN